jgi:O-antigen ligase
VGTVAAILLVVTIGYRDSKIGILILSGTIGVGLAGAIFVKPQLGSYILIVSVFTNMSSNFIDQGLPGTNKPLIALVFIGILANRLLARQEAIPWPKRTEWFLLGVGGVWLLSAFGAQDQYLATERVVDFAKDFVLILCVAYPLTIRPKSWQRAIWIVILSAAGLAGLGAYQLLSGNTAQTFFGFSEFMEAQIVDGADDAARLIGPLADPNFYGQILVAVLPLAIYRTISTGRLSMKLVAGGASLLMAFAIINTYSRGAFVAMVLLLALIAIERRIRLPVLLLLAAASLVMLPFLPAGFTARLETLSIITNDKTTVHAEDSFRGRTSEMLAGFNMFVDHPLLGVGAANYPVQYQDYAARLGLEQRTENREAHSLYLEVAAETGLFGIVAFVGLFASLLVALQNARRRLAQRLKDQAWDSWIVSLQFAIVGYLTTSLFLHGDYLRYLWLLVALGIAVLHLADYQQPVSPAAAPSPRRPR